MENYITHFKKLRTLKQKGRPSPHKPILLMSVLDLIESGEMVTNKILLTDSLNAKFTSNWSKFIDDDRCNNRNLIKTPFERMNSEPFWTSIPGGKEAIMDSNLFDLLQDEENINRVRSVLIGNYLSYYMPQTPHKVEFGELDPAKDDSLRPYQVDNKRRIYDFWQRGRSVMLQMPTGTGKTRLFVSIVRDLHDWGVRNRVAVKVLLLAHRVELIDQISENLGKKYNLAHGRIASGSSEERVYPIQVGSVPTMHRRMDSWGEKDFDVIIVDEAHHITADSYRTILEGYPNAKVLGVTATPYRLSGSGFKSVFEDLIISDAVSKFIDNGYLSNYDYYSIAPSSEIHKQIETISDSAITGDYDESSMQIVMDTDRVRARIVDAYLRYAKGKKGIVYTINQTHNVHVCEQFMAKGVKAIAIDSNTNAEDRKAIVEDFKRGKFQVLCNVNIFSEGFDCPDLEFVQLARPTKSLSMFLQQIGRGLRTSEGKSKAIFLDNVGLYSRFGLPSANRKWRMHFEGRDVTAEDLKGGCSIEDTREVIFMRDLEEGDDEVELIQSTKIVEEENSFVEEVVKELLEPVIDDIQIEVLKKEKKESKKQESKGNGSREAVIRDKIILFFEELTKEEPTLNKLDVNIKYSKSHGVRIEYDKKYSSSPKKVLNENWPSLSQAIKALKNEIAKDISIFSSFKKYGYCDDVSILALLSPRYISILVSFSDIISETDGLSNGALIRKKYKIEDESTERVDAFVEYYVRKIEFSISDIVKMLELYLKYTSMGGAINSPVSNDSFRIVTHTAKRIIRINQTKEEFMRDDETAQRDAIANGKRIYVRK